MRYTWLQAPRFDRELGNSDDRYYHLVLLAENNRGYQNLMKIVSKSFKEGFYYKPRVDTGAFCREYHEGGADCLKRLPGRRGGTIYQPWPVRGCKKAALRYPGYFRKRQFFLSFRIRAFRSSRECKSAAPSYASGDRESIWLPPTIFIILYAEDADPHDILLCLADRKEADRY